METLVMDRSQSLTKALESRVTEPAARMGMRVKDYQSWKDEALMDEVQLGEVQALETLISRYQQRLMSIAWRIVRNQSLAEDIVQEVFIRVWHRSHLWQNRAGGRFGAWIARITTNLAIDYKRRPVVESLDDSLEIVSPHSNSYDIASGHQIGERIQAALQKLPPRQRLAFVLCQIDGLSNAEVAREMNSSVGAVELLLVRARLSLRTSLRDLIREE
ncbi:MAG: sigma-70 family RNA polymerase sigma factor [Candidatus Pacebacteria bacterium]|nr:sigma-70 family RNA polymerase sigma factor [Candidatus Paceibacterota bacterium]